MVIVGSLLMARSLVAFVLLPIFVSALLQVQYPLNLQLPPVAIVDSPYSFQFAPTTFQTDSDTVQYSLVGNPSWLLLDSKSRTLSGIPRVSDVGEISFTIAAAGFADAVVHMDSKLLVTGSNMSEAKGNITQVLATTGQLSGPSIVNIGPSNPFDISFPTDTFDGHGELLSYYALLADHTPLPAWVSFDASTLRFAGTTPPTSYPQTLEILLVACNIPGYASSSLSFTILISSHQLLFEPYSQTLNLSKGDEIRIADLKSKLFLDGSPVQDTQVQSINATLPSWLKLDNKTSEIFGSAPSGTMSEDLTITATDQYGDAAQLRIHIAFSSELFATEIGELNATSGEVFEYTIPQKLLANSDERLSVDLSSLSRYLHFDSVKSSISGTIEHDFPSQRVQCILTAITSDGTQRDTQTFLIAVSNAVENTSTEPPPGNGNAHNINERKHGGEAAGVIIGSVVGAICGVLLLVTLFLCLHRRKQRKNYMSPKLPRSPNKSDISRPILISNGWPDMDLDQDQDLEKGKGEHDFLVERAPEQPPKLDLDLPTRKSDSGSLTDSIGVVDTHILDTFEESSWGFQNDIAPSRHPHESMKIPTEELTKRASQRSDFFRKHRRQTTTVYQDQIHRSSGLPVNRRITGMGHGRQAYSPSRSNTNFSQSSKSRPISTSSYSTARCTSTYSTAPSTFPQPPAARQQTANITTPAEARRSIRVVQASTRSSLADRPLDEKRNSYIRKRASAQSPFFSAAGNRVSSSIYKSPPAFIDAPSTRNTIFRPDDDGVESDGKDLPNKDDIFIPSSNPTKEFPGSLRKNRVVRPYTSSGIHRNRVEKSYTRPGTTIVTTSGGIGRCASTRDSLRACELKARLNDLTGSDIFKDADLSDSVYTDEEDEIEEAEKRTTVKPSQYTLPPLNIGSRRRSKRRSADNEKRASKRDSHRELKRTSERDPTPFYTSYHVEHGGKENQSSTYKLGIRSTSVRSDSAGNTRARNSPEPLKAAASHARTVGDAQSIALQRTSKVLSQTENPKQRQSRKSMHSHSESRQSRPAGKKTHSRAQSTAYPHFDATSIETRPSSVGNGISTAADATSGAESPNTRTSVMTRDLSGNLTFYADDEEPTVEELGSSSIGFRTTNGRISSTARRSHLASLHESSQFGSPSPPPKSPPPKSAKRKTARKTIPAVVAPSSPAAVVKPAVGLGLFPVDVNRDRQTTSSSVILGEDRTTPGVEDSSGLEVPKGRQTWGSVKSMVGRGSRWVSGGYWDKQGTEDKVFI